MEPEMRPVAVDSPLMVNALLALGQLNSWNVKEIVLRLVARGYDCPPFRTLLGHDDLKQSDWEPLLRRGNQMHGFHPLTQFQAAVVVVWEVIHEVLEGRLEPLAGAKRIVSLGDTVESYRTLTTVFVELVWAFEAHEPPGPFGWLSKEQLTDMIMVEMRKLIGMAGAEERKAATH